MYNFKTNTVPAQINKSDLQHIYSFINIFLELSFSWFLHAAGMRKMCRIVWCRVLGLSIPCGKLRSLGLVRQSLLVGATCDSNARDLQVILTKEVVNLINNTLIICARVCLG